MSSPTTTTTQGTSASWNLESLQALREKYQKSRERTLKIVNAPEEGEMNSSSRTPLAMRTASQVNQLACASPQLLSPSKKNSSVGMSILVENKKMTTEQVSIVVVPEETNSTNNMNVMEEDTVSEYPDSKNILICSDSATDSKDQGQDNHTESEVVSDVSTSSQLSPVPDRVMMKSEEVPGSCSEEIDTQLNSPANVGLSDYELRRREFQLRLGSVPLRSESTPPLQAHRHCSSQDSQRKVLQVSSSIASSNSELKEKSRIPRPMTSARALSSETGREPNRNGRNRDKISGTLESTSNSVASSGSHENHLPSNLVRPRSSSSRGRVPDFAKLHAKEEARLRKRMEEKESKRGTTVPQEFDLATQKIATRGANKTSSKSLEKSEDYSSTTEEPATSSVDEYSHSEKKITSSKQVTKPREFNFSTESRLKRREEKRREQETKMIDDPSDRFEIIQDVGTGLSVRDAPCSTFSSPSHSPLEKISSTNIIRPGNAANLFPETRRNVDDHRIRKEEQDLEFEIDTSALDDILNERELDYRQFHYATTTKSEEPSTPVLKSRPNHYTDGFVNSDRKEVSEELLAKRQSMFHGALRVRKRGNDKDNANVVSSNAQRTNTAVERSHIGDAGRQSHRATSVNRRTTKGESVLRMTPFRTTIVKPSEAPVTPVWERRRSQGFGLQNSRTKPSRRIIDQLSESISNINRLRTPGSFGKSSRKNEKGTSVRRHRNGDSSLLFSPKTRSAARRRVDEEGREVTEHSNLVQLRKSELENNEVFSSVETTLNVEPAARQLEFEDMISQEEDSSSCSTDIISASRSDQTNRNRPAERSTAVPPNPISLSGNSFSRFVLAGERDSVSEGSDVSKKSVVNSARSFTSPTMDSSSTESVHEFRSPQSAFSCRENAHRDSSLLIELLMCTSSDEENLTSLLHDTDDNAENSLRCKDANQEDLRPMAPVPLLLIDDGESKSTELYNPIQFSADILKFRTPIRSKPSRC